MIGNPIRWWTRRALGRSPLSRRADRTEAWAILAGLVLLIGAVFPAMAVGEVGYAARSGANAVEAATRHAVDATAVANSKADPVISDAVPTTFSVRVRWFAHNETHDAVTKVDRPVKAGDRVPVWVDDRGDLTTAPLTDDDVHLVAAGTAALVWLAAAIAVGAAFAVLRAALERSRNRAWDRELYELVGNGGGSANFRP
jgi:hypothetical protein